MDLISSVLRQMPGIIFSMEERASEYPCDIWEADRPCCSESRAALDRRDDAKSSIEVVPSWTEDDKDEHDSTNKRATGCDILSREAIKEPVDWGKNDSDTR